MDWARRRKTMIAFGIVLVMGAIVALGWYFFIYQPPSCNDGILNQAELGIDCDGPCKHMCVVPRVDALWSRAVKTSDGVYHGVALVKNPLSNGSATGLNYTMSLYDSGNILVAERRGTFDLAPGETRVLFEANIITRERTPVRAFMKIDGGSWDKADVTAQVVRIIPGVVDEEKRTFTATFENTTPRTVSAVIADALLYDAEGILITASESRIPTIPPRGRQDVVFTWSQPFAKPVITQDIVVRLDATP